MSTVPPAAALVLALPLLLVLLLQPTAAKATAAKAAIAVFRLMMFLSLFEVVRLPWSVPTGPVRAYGPATAGKVVGSTEAFTATAPPWEPIPARTPGRANVAAGTSAGDFPP
jgi:hypothetical protein